MSQFLDSDRQETQEWVEALDDIIATRGEERAQFLMQRLQDHAYRRTVPLPAPTTPYVNTIPRHEQPFRPLRDQPLFHRLQLFRRHPLT